MNNSQSFFADDQHGNSHVVFYRTVISDEPATMATEGQAAPLIHAYFLKDRTRLVQVEAGKYRSADGKIVLTSPKFD